MSKHMKNITTGLSTALLITLGLSACGYPGDEDDRAAAAGGSEQHDEQSAAPTDEDTDDQQDEEDDQNTDSEDEGSDDDEEGSGDEDEEEELDLPSIDVIPDDLDEDEVTVYLAAEQRFSPTLVRIVIHGDAAEDVAGSEIEATRWNCLGSVQDDSMGQISEDSDPDREVYDIEWLPGENPYSGGGSGTTQYDALITDQIFANGNADDDAGTTNLDGQLSKFGGMCGDVAQFVLP